MRLEDITREVARRTELHVTDRSIERILQALLRTNDFWEVVDLADEIVPIVAETIRVLQEQGWVRIEGKAVQLTETAHRTLTAGWHIRPLPEVRCLRCEGRGVDPFRLPQDKIDQFYAIQAERPRAVIEYDQGYITPESTLARFAFADAKGDIRGRRVLILGDDDLVSIATCLFGEPREVVVVEIDQRLVEFIERWAREFQWPLIVRQIDLSQPLPGEYIRAFDTFLTDPPESVPAFRAFVGRGIAALRGAGCAGYFGFTRREATLRKWYDIEQYLIRQGVVITDILHNFHAYVNWDYAPKTRAWRLAPVKSVPEKPWYRSGLFRIEVLEEARGEVDTVFEVSTFNDAEASTT